MRWEKPSDFPARCRMTQPKTLERLGVFNLLWPPCPVLWETCHGQLVPQAGLGKSSLCVPQQLLKLDFFISMIRGQGGKEVTFVIVLFSWWTRESAHLGVWKYMAKSLFLLILSWFKRCKIPSEEEHLDLHLETNEQKPNQICTKLYKKQQHSTKTLGAVVCPDWNAVGSSSPVKCTARILHGKTGKCKRSP